MPAAGELGIRPRLERRPAPLLQARDLGLGERLVREVGERRPAPHPQRLVQRLCGEPGIGTGQRAHAARDELLEPVDVALAGRDVQPVCAAERLEPPVAAQRLPQRRDLVVQHLVRGRRRRRAPQLLHEPIARDELVGAEHEQAQQRALTPRADRERGTAVVVDFEGAEQSEVQR